jgi:MFS family permease
LRAETTRDGDPLRARAGAERWLDWLIFFVADIQTGFGPFVAVFLTSAKWPQADIGLLLTASTLAGLLAQIPAGAAVDASRSLRLVVALALLALGVSALAFVSFPIFAVALATRLLHAVASSILNLSLVSLSLALVGVDRMSVRLGRNAAFASAGTGVAAGLMGFFGYYWSSRAVFVVAAALVIPALFALSRIEPGSLGRDFRESRAASADLRTVVAASLALARERSFVILLVCLVLFHLANAAMLPLAASMVTQRSSQAATAMVAGAILAPQFITTLLSPWVGRRAQIWGRRKLMLLGYAALATRGLLLAMTTDPPVLVLIQALDGISAAALGVVAPLMIVDLTRTTGHFNLALGSAGAATAIGASVSTSMAGYLSDRFGFFSAFGVLAAIAFVGLVAVATAMPETAPSEQAHSPR